MLSVCFAPPQDATTEHAITAATMVTRREISSTDAPRPGTTRSDMALAASRSTKA
jgi:hypothetical protein